VRHTRVLGAKANIGAEPDNGAEYKIRIHMYYNIMILNNYILRWIVMITDLDSAGLHLLDSGVNVTKAQATTFKVNTVPEPS
jgi:hypothetical protein